MFPCLMVIDAAVYFRDVFICHSQLTGSSHCRNHKKSNKDTLLFVCSLLFRGSDMPWYIIEFSSGSQRTQEHCISPKIREQELTSVSLLRLNHTFLLSL